MNPQEPADILEVANEVVSNLLPTKSKKNYEKVYKDFVNWCTTKKVEIYTENVLLAYFNELAKKYKSSTLWSYYSMLKSTISINKNIDISSYLKLIAFLKRQAEGYSPKKAKILTKDEIEKFLLTAPDETYLMIKVALIFGIAGACRRDELLKLSTDDIQILETSILVSLRDTKNKSNRVFTIVNPINSAINYLDLCKTYFNLRPPHITHKRLFISFRSNKCQTSPVGKNTFSKIPERIATYLKLPEPHSYTGHCLRRSSATLLAESGADMSILKRHGGLKSTSVAEGYIEDSINNKNKIAHKILGPDVDSSPSTSNVDVTNANCFSASNTTNTININNNKKGEAPLFSVTNCSHFNININYMS